MRRRAVGEDGRPLPAGEIHYDALFLVSDCLYDDEDDLLRIAAGYFWKFPAKSSYDNTFPGSVLGHPQLTGCHQLWIEPVGADEVLDGFARSGYFQEIKILFGLCYEARHGWAKREEAKRQGRNLALFQAISLAVLGPRGRCMTCLDDLGIYSLCDPIWITPTSPDDWNITYDGRRTGGAKASESPDVDPSQMVVSEHTKRRLSRASRKKPPQLPKSSYPSRKDQVASTSELQPDPDSATMFLGKRNSGRLARERPMAHSSMLPSSSLQGFSVIMPGSGSFFSLGFGASLERTEDSSVFCDDGLSLSLLFSA